MTSRVDPLEEELAWTVDPHKKVVDRIMQNSKTAISLFPITKAGCLALFQAQVCLIY